MCRNSFKSVDKCECIAEIDATCLTHSFIARIRSICSVLFVCVFFSRKKCSTRAFCTSSQISFRYFFVIFTYFLLKQMHFYAIIFLFTKIYLVKFKSFCVTKIQSQKYYKNIKVQQLFFCLDK